MQGASPPHRPLLDEFAPDDRVTYLDSGASATVQGTNEHGLIRVVFDVDAPTGFEHLIRPDRLIRASR